MIDISFSQISITQWGPWIGYENYGNIVPEFEKLGPKYFLKIQKISITIIILVNKSFIVVDNKYWLHPLIFYITVGNQFTCEFEKKLAKNGSSDRKLSHEKIVKRWS